MSRIREFTDFIVWQKADDLFVDAAKDVEGFPKTRAGFLIADHILRSIGSIGANIAEGFGRKGKNEFAYHLGIARGESNEAINWYHKSQWLNFLPKEIFEVRKKSLIEIQKMLSTLISKVKK